MLQYVRSSSFRIHHIDPSPPKSFPLEKILLVMNFSELFWRQSLKKNHVRLFNVLLLYTLFCRTFLIIYIFFIPITTNVHQQQPQTPSRHRSVSLSSDICKPKNDNTRSPGNPGTFFAHRRMSQDPSNKKFQFGIKNLITLIYLKVLEIFCGKSRDIGLSLHIFCHKKAKVVFAKNTRFNNKSYFTPILKCIWLTLVTKNI